MSTYSFGKGVPTYNGIPMIGGTTLPFTTGKYIWVSSVIGSNNNTGKSPAKPVATINKALDLATASNGDVIVCMPGHAESVVGAGGIAIDVIGVQVIGCGVGALRPTITLGTLTTATVTMTAANTSLKNFIFSAHLDNIATAIGVAAKDVTIENNEFRDESNALHFLTCVTTSAVANACDGLTVINNKRNGLAAAATAFVSILEGNDRVTLNNNLVVDAAATGDVGHFVTLSTFNLTNAEIAYNKLILPAASAVAVGTFMTGSGTGQTGVVHNNYVHSIDTSSALFCTATLTFGLFENYQSGLVNGSGLLWPAADTPS